MTTLAPVLQAFFTERLMAQRRASSHTITGYRDTLRLLVGFACAKTGKTPSALDIADLDAPLVAAFLDHLEADRHNTVRTRNWRLAAIHSLFGYAALHHPERAAVIQRVLAIPAKRHERTLLTWLTAPEAGALLAAPDRATRAGRRDHAMLVLAVQTGLRISELIGLSRGDVVPGAGAHVRCMGKGRKERATPLTGLTVAVLRAWLTENPGQAHDPLFPTRTGTRLSHDAIEHRLAVHLATARASCPSLRTKHATMHTLRHTCAMRVKGAGIDVAVIALWLGHEQMATAITRRHGGERASHRPSHPARHGAWPLPAARPATRLPRQPLIVPTCRQSIAQPRKPIRAQVGTITTSDQSALFRCRDNADSERADVATVHVGPRKDHPILCGRWMGVVGRSR
jgi:integrase/recombinase XerD